eukprot:CAMPEP_0195584038 /NCGR_PEP_ID=MMETSP0814-20130614/25175_1 /TAXON_ID=97485 /ORGANISM="Prymnesium parvum, Strain Texoma1" /LENGTH=40 /DNA_ID= /DNA_START= /DNA_END= /DNA_ORIENTATION=
MSANSSIAVASFSDSPPRGEWSHPNSVPTFIPSCTRGTLA